MQKLIDEGLFGDGLLNIDQPSMIERYNACLREIGLPESSLNRFQIDGWGWSPQIAEERDDPFYLSHLGVANPYIIIVSPLQKGKPVYFPYHSFDADMLTVVWGAAENQMADITTTTAVWIDVDQEVSSYSEPQDLLMIDNVTLRFNSVGGIMIAKKEQAQLVHAFLNQRMAWSDRNLHEKIIENVSKHGDLRFRQLVIPEVHYTKTTTFYTRAFDGMFVFRAVKGNQPVLVLEEKERAQFSGETEHGHIEFWIKDERLLKRLYDEELVDLQWTLYRDNPTLLSRLQECLLMQTISESDAQIDLNVLRDGDRKRYMLQLASKGALPTVYQELERMLIKIQRGQVVDLTKASLELTLALSHPHRRLKGEAWNTVRQLLVKLAPWDIIKLYSYDKEEFYTRYQTWPENFKAWAVTYISQHINN
ncbi:MAG: hypothetical protein ACI959_001000 [Limisphaerales bacterium]